MSATPPMPPTGPGAPPAKKKTSPLVWVAVGCGGLLVLVLIVGAALTFWVGSKVKEAGNNPALFAAKMIAAADKDIEVVSSDDDAQTVTLRNTKTGQTITVNAEDIKEGRLKFTDEKGEELTFDASGEGESGSLKISSDKGDMTFGAGSEAQVPDWVPVQSGAEIEGTYAATSDEGVDGGFGYTSASSAEDVIRFYKEKLEAEGFSVSTSTFNQNGAIAGGIVTGEKDGGARRVQVSLSVDEGKTGVAVIYHQGT